MKPVEREWRVRPRDLDREKRLVEELGLSPLVAQLLANRDIGTSNGADRFLNPRLSDLYDPFLFPDMDKACERIWKAVQRGEKVLIYGDYDVDGVTATALLVLILREVGAKVEYYLPHRLEEGYGLNQEAVARAKKDGVKLLITVDCGISAMEEAQLASRSGIDLIITDHHEPGREVPEAFAIINPAIPGCPYPFHGLAGVGVAFKLAHALMARGERNAPADPRVFDHLDLVALGSIADVVPLLDENRVLAKFGLQALGRSGKLGVQALLKVSGVENTKLSSGHVGFMLGPRINATGRLGRSNAAVELLLSDTSQKAIELAQELNTLNQQRQEMQREVLDAITKRIEEDADIARSKALVYDDPAWHPGIIGIVASRLADTYHRPTLLISRLDGLCRGTARSIPDFDIHAALMRCDEHLTKLGGHQSAAGFELQESQLKPFAKRFFEVTDQLLDDRLLTPHLYADADVDIAQMTVDLVDEINRFDPFGIGNHRPLFLVRNIELKGNAKIVGNRHLKFWISQNGHTAEVIGFNMADRQVARRRPSEELEILFSPHINIWKGTASVQLNLKDFRWVDGPRNAKRPPALAARARSMKGLP